MNPWGASHRWNYVFVLLWLSFLNWHKVYNVLVTVTLSLPFKELSVHTTRCWHIYPFCLHLLFFWDRLLLCSTSWLQIHIPSATVSFWSAEYSMDHHVWLGLFLPLPTSSRSSRDLHIHHHTVCRTGTGSKPEASHVKTPNTDCHPVLVKQIQN